MGTARYLILETFAGDTMAAYQQESVTGGSYDNVRLMLMEGVSQGEAIESLRWMLAAVSSRWDELAGNAEVWMQGDKNGGISFRQW